MESHQQDSDRRDGPGGLLRRREAAIYAPGVAQGDDGYIDAVPVDYLGSGETATVDLEGRPVTVANADGQWCAYESTCPHQSTPLGGVPLLKKTLLRCPEHGSVFDVATGQCVLASDDGWSGPLRTYQTRVAGDVVQILLD